VRGRARTQLSAVGVGCKKAGSVAPPANSRAPTHEAARRLFARSSPTRVSRIARSRYADGRQAAPPVQWLARCPTASPQDREARERARSRGDTGDPLRAIVYPSRPHPVLQDFAGLDHSAAVKALDLAL